MFCIFKYFSPSFITKEQFMPQVVALFILELRKKIFLFFFHCSLSAPFHLPDALFSTVPWRNALIVLTPTTDGSVYKNYGNAFMPKQKAMTSQYYDYSQFMKTKVLLKTILLLNSFVARFAFLSYSTYLRTVYSVTFFLFLLPPAPLLPPWGSAG